MIDIKEHIKEKQEKVKKLNEEIAELDELAEKYPDLKIDKNRWGTIRYSSPSVNNKANHFYTGYSCGCCPDAWYDVYTYFEDDTGPRIYTKPVLFNVGKRCPYGDNYINFDWDKELKEAGIPKELIEKIGEYLESEKEE